MSRKTNPNNSSFMLIRSRRSARQKLLIAVLAIVLFLIIVFPFYWIVLSSFKTFLEIFEVPPSIIPVRLDLFNYIEAFEVYQIGTFILNSLFVTIITVLCTTIISTCASFSVTRLEFKGSKQFQNFLKMTQMFPVVVLLVPLFLMCAKLNLYGTQGSLILPYIALQIPVSVILLSTYFVDIPMEIEEAAIIDGCNLFQTFTYVMLPLAVSGIVAVSIYTFIQVWQEFLIASSFITKHSSYTLTVGLTTFHGEFINWGGLMATSVIIAVPAMVLFTVSQDFFINRLAGGVKE
ncbi:carbohydrate ABC transporter membrane protein 2, CUT1 family [Sphaerochaeta associata]|uniref:Carbohydrate ABC transporter permease n=1 Tax=Sphaerochaeta associata TaxID=1129264 RepID=A0ABY4DDE7_9SPIR|nr:carbohydrate ABC transporter permease [Sphaerochaeta associata]UOM51099.1 carbohydrate ABC transporter permease [Sphaerochaeta associata]SMP56414.1 carbohydrate ABC transporter membrane protein 2, CUT1 family [Sphaerochaeta associata]